MAERVGFDPTVRLPRQQPKKAASILAVKGKAVACQVKEDMGCGRRTERPPGNRPPVQSSVRTDTGSTLPATRIQLLERESAGLPLISTSKALLVSRLFSGHQPKSRYQKFVTGYRSVVRARQGLMLGMRQPLDGLILEILEDAQKQKHPCQAIPFQTSNL